MVVNIEMAFHKSTYFVPISGYWLASPNHINVQLL